MVPVVERAAQEHIAVTIFDSGIKTDSFAHRGECETGRPAGKAISYRVTTPPTVVDPVPLHPVDP
jgi:hypothetical protein